MEKNDNEYYALIGSSNLTNAAFNHNYEANILSPISEQQFLKAVEWINNIEKYCEIVTQEWIDNYNPTIPLAIRVKSFNQYNKQIKYILTGSNELISDRRKQIQIYKSKESIIKKYIFQCAKGELHNDDFYNKLKDILKEGITFQPKFGWSRRGKKDNFKLFCQSLLRIYEANESSRDEVITREINKLKEHNISNRGALLSELLCLEYPDKYPLVNRPVIEFLKNIGTLENKGYIQISKILRNILLDMDNVNNLAELDILIQSKYR